MNKYRVGIFAATLAAIATLTFPAVANGAPVGTPSADTPAQRLPEQSISGSVKSMAPEDFPAQILPLPSAELMDWASDVQRRFESDRSFSSIKLSDDRLSSTIYWHDAVSPTLRRVIASAPANVEIVVAQTTFSPGALRDLAKKLIDQPSDKGGMTVEHSYANVDGSGVTVGIKTDEQVSIRNNETGIAQKTSPRNRWDRYTDNGPERGRYIASLGSSR